MLLKHNISWEKLTSPEYRILNAPFYKNPGSDNILWKKEINLDAGRYKARGFLAILEEINQDVFQVSML